MRITTLLAAAAAMTVATPALAQNVVNNGSFENGLNGWNVTTTGGGTAPVVITYNNSSGYPTGAFGEPIAPDNATSLSPDAVGTHTLYFSSDTASPHSISQLVNLIAGQTYNIGFDYYAPQNGINNPFDATLGFSLGGSQIGSILTAGSPSGTPARTWLNFGTSFTATQSGPQNLALNFNGGGVTAADFAVDRVYLTAAVPEPATWALMLIGFGGMGIAMRRRRRTSAALPQMA